MNISTLSFSIKPLSAVVALAVTALVGLPRSLSAEDLFVIGTDTGVQGGGSSLPYLVEDFLLARGQFSGLENEPEYDAELRYAGVANAIEMEVNALGTNVTLRIPSTGFERNFSGLDREDVEQQIEDFIQDEGAREWGKFQSEMAKRSLVAVTDGNPNSTTARAADGTFQEFGRRPASTRASRRSAASGGGRFGFSFFPGYSRFEAGEFDGEAYSLHFALRARLTDRVGIALVTPAAYVRLEGAEVYHLGATAGIPLILIPDRGGSRWFWQVTPSGGLMGSGSIDFAGGGLVEHFAGTSLLSYSLGNVVLSMGNQYGTYRGRNTSYDDYDIHTHVNQRIVKHGLTLSLPFGRNWAMDLYGEDTHFRRDAAIDHYNGLGGNLVYQFGGGRGYFRAGLVHEFADDYSAYTGQAGFGMRF